MTARQRAEKYLQEVVTDYQRIFRDDQTTRGLPEICSKLFQLEYWEGIIVRLCCLFDFAVPEII